MEGKDSADADWAPPSEDMPRPFDVINGDLAALGALSVDDFLNDNFNPNPNAPANFDVNFYVQVPEALASPVKEKDSRNSRKSENNPVTVRNAVAILRETCKSVFGSPEALKYDYREDSPQCRQCIITITRPNGATRSYTSGLASMSRPDVRGLAALAAINLGALDFIAYGDADALKAKQGLLLNPLDVVDADGTESTTPASTTPTPVKAPSPKEDPTDRSLKEIEMCCEDWRAGKIKPRWFAFTAVRNKKKHGAAVRITLNPHVFRSYSVEAVYDSPNEAKYACAKAAIQEGVLEFIMYGNGQTEPAKIHDDDLVENMSDTGTPPPMKAMSLQDYFDSLPKPFPEELEPGNAVEANAPSFLNILLQTARGGRMNAFFQPIIDTMRQFHGCILRIDRPGETKTYIMDPQFTKRVDAKPAVCLLALSQGVGDYIRGIRDMIDNKLSSEMRVMANTKFMQALASECARVRPGNRMNFLYFTERDAFACTLKIDISEDESRPDVREYVVDADYRNKADAKAGVVAHAVEQGVIDLLRFRGATPPPDYTPYWDTAVNGKGDNYSAKRKEPVELDGETRDLKKRRKGNRDESPEYGEIVPPPVTTTPAKTLPEPPHGLPQKPNFVVSLPDGRSNGRSWKKSQANGSRGLGPANAHANASLPRSVGQDRSGNMSGGLPLPAPRDDREHGHGRNERDYVEPHPSSYHPPPPPSEYLPYDDYRKDYSYSHEHYPPEHYPAPEHYPPNAYGHAYSHTPSPSHTSSGSGYHPSAVYHSPPPPQPLPPIPATPHYAAYYTAGPPHGHYGHYPYVGSYQHPPPHPYAHYPHDPYAQYPGPVIYSPPPPTMPSPTHVQHTEPYPQRYRSPSFAPPPPHYPPPRSPTPPPPPPPPTGPRHSAGPLPPSGPRIPTGPRIPAGPRSWQMNQSSDFVQRSELNGHGNGNGAPRNRHPMQDDSSRNRLESMRRDIPRTAVPVNERDGGGRNLGRQPSSSSHSSKRTADTERRPSIERSSTKHQDESTIFFGQQPPDDIDSHSRSPSPGIMIPPNAIIASDLIVERTRSPPPPSKLPEPSNPPNPIPPPHPPVPSNPPPSTPHSLPTYTPAPYVPQAESDPPASKSAVSHLPKSITPTPTPPPGPKPRPYMIDSPPPNTNLCMLYEFCANQKIIRPAFYYQSVKRIDGDGMAYKVWAEKDAQRLQLPSPFLTIEEGCEKLAKKVLQWERTRLKRNSSA